MLAHSAHMKHSEGNRDVDLSWMLSGGDGDPPCEGSATQAPARNTGRSSAAIKNEPVTQINESCGKGLAN
jgi:hypothetical protein